MHVVETPGDVRRPKHHHKYDERSKIIVRKIFGVEETKKSEWLKRTRSYHGRFRSGGEEKFYEKKRCRGRRQNASLERTDDECERFYVIERRSDHTRGGVRETTFGKRAKTQSRQKHETTTEREKKKRDASTSRASSTSPAPSLARAQHQHSSMNPSGSMPQYLGVPPPKSLSVLRRDAGESSFECANFATTHSSSSAMKRDDVDLNSEIDRYIMVTLLERERDVVRGKADVLRATSGKISSALEKERKSLKSKSGKENKKQKTLAATTATSTDPDPSSLQDSLSNVFGALFSGVAPATEEEQQKRNLLERSSSSDTTTTTTMHMNNDTSVQDLCGELLKNERFIHMHAASGSVLDSRFINGRRDAPGIGSKSRPRFAGAKEKQKIFVVVEKEK